MSTAVFNNLAYTLPKRWKMARTLKPGEKIAWGDKWWNTRRRCWHPMGYSVGNIVEGPYLNTLIIRKTA